MHISAPFPTSKAATGADKTCMAELSNSDEHISFDNHVHFIRNIANLIGMSFTILDVLIILLLESYSKAMFLSLSPTIILLPRSLLYCNNWSAWCSVFCFSVFIPSRICKTLARYNPKPQKPSDWSRVLSGLHRISRNSIKSLNHCWTWNSY